MQASRKQHSDRREAHARSEHTLRRVLRGHCGAHPHARLCQGYAQYAEAGLANSLKLAAALQDWGNNAANV